MHPEIELSGSETDMNQVVLQNVQPDNDSDRYFCLLRYLTAFSLRGSRRLQQLRQPLKLFHGSLLQSRSQIGAVLLRKSEIPE